MSAPWMIDAREWQDAILPPLAELPLTAPSYAAGARSLRHYKAVSRILLARFHDVALARAGFLHGIHPAELAALRQMLDVREADEIGSILEDRNRLRSIGGTTSQQWIFNDAEGDEVARQLVTNVLPLMRDARSVVLFVLEQINHLDSTGEFSDWTLRFRVNPVPMPPEGNHFVADHFPNMRVRVRFLRFVVSVAADWFGLWAERNAALNLALFHENRDRFEEIVDRILEDHESDVSASRERVEFVRQRLGDAPVDVQWEWYSVAAIYRHLEFPLSQEAWSRRFERLGCVTVVCRDEPECYATLQRLHAGGNYGENTVRDYIGEPRSSGYRALHTALMKPKPGGRTGFADLVPLHIMSRHDWERQLAPSGIEHLQRIAARISRDEHRVLTVLAHDGRAIDLPPGSVVLNFVVKLHSHLLARVRGATVNRRPVGLLHPLRPGDIVWLDVGETPQMLPHGWESQVPQSTVPRIRKEIPRAYRKMLIEDGVRWLREQLASHGLESVSDPELAHAVQSASEDVLSRSEDAQWVYRQLGAHEAIDRGVTLLTPALDRAQANAIANKVVVVLRESPSVMAGYEIPEAFAGRYDETVTCEICEPSSDEPRSGTLDGRLLVIHRAHAPCAPDALLLRRPLQDVVRRHYFVAETANGANNMVEILSAFRENNVDIASVAARRLNAGWRVVRVGCDYVTPARRVRIERTLRDLPGVIRVTGPTDPPIPAIEDVLPPRSLDSASMRRREPYQAGPAIEDDRLFYGMEAELNTLDDIFQRVSNPNAGSGEFAFVTGPLRIGKTSMVKQFLRRLNRDPDRPHFAIYHMPSIERWSTVAEDIQQTLLDRIPHLPPVVREQPTLEKAIRELRRTQHLPLVLVIDELVGLLQLNGEWPEEVEAFRRFHAGIRATPGVFVIWIGPTAAVRRLDSAIAQLLTNSEWVRPATFTPQDVEGALRAAKMGSLYNIELKGELVKKVRRLTDGNPYWVEHLGKQMFDIEATRHGQQRVTYSYGTLALAKERLFLQPVAFVHHVGDVSNEIERKKLAILQTLAGLKGDNRYVPPSALHAALRSQVHHAEIDTYIEDMYLAGSVAIENDKIKVAAPLLAEYVRFISKKEAAAQ